MGWGSEVEGWVESLGGGLEWVKVFQCLIQRQAHTEQVHTCVSGSCKPRDLSWDLSSESRSAKLPPRFNTRAS